MALSVTLKNTFFFVGIIALIFIVIVLAEIAFVYFVDIKDELRKRHSKPDWWEE